MHILIILKNSTLADIDTFLLIRRMPESPRWLILKGHETEAREVMACLDELPLDDPTIDVRVNEIKESLELAAGVGVKDLFTFGPERNFHRTLLGFIIQMFQQIRCVLAGRISDWKPGRPIRTPL